MPRVSEEHLERRRQQILDAAQVCFTRKGFHETSMQDVFTESGLSAGAVYRYFTSKNEIIRALVTNTMGPLRARLAEIIRTDELPPLAEVVRLLTTEIVRRSGPGGPLRLAPQAWALAMVQPDSGVPVREAIASMRELWREYGERLRERGDLPADADLDAFAKTIIGVLPGFILQHLLLEDITPDDLARGLELLLPMSTP
ncbi:TetR/AcrR family transcriptional regulator [Nocardia sp. AG03]|uniref:TetR/AcrR family transcriptional regulator n=1 Tax=Nocardia sp. AG03 TaxID=3025312 RepID=UPI0024182AB4|nr:TetR/AcrR family transcriptional regulator [Nocardia sp. AG03]